MCISLCKDAINEKPDAKKNAKLNDSDYILDIFDNWDTRKQLLAHSGYRLFNSPNKWSETQKNEINDRNLKKADLKILFREYTDLKQSFPTIHSLKMVYNKNCIKTYSYRWSLILLKVLILNNESNKSICPTTVLLISISRIPLHGRA